MQDMDWGRLNYTTFTASLPRANLPPYTTIVFPYIYKQTFLSGISVALSQSWFMCLPIITHQAWEPAKKTLAGWLSTLDCRLSFWFRVFHIWMNPSDLKPTKIYPFHPAKPQGHQSGADEYIVNFSSWNLRVKNQPTRSKKQQESRILRNLTVYMCMVWPLNSDLHAELEFYRENYINSNWWKHYCKIMFISR